MRLARNTAALFLLVCAGLNSARGQAITGFQPKFGSPGETVLLFGSAFLTPTQVQYARLGDLFTTGYVNQDDIMQITVPIGATSGLISVSKDGWNWVYSPQVFTVIGPGPYISGFTPTSGNAGTLVFIQGAHFPGTTAVRFNGVNASSFFVEAENQIQAYAPANVTTGPITVITALGSHTSSANFNVPPSIYGFAPTTGRAGTNVVITGRNFTGASAVYFNGLNAAFTVNSLTNITVTVPSGATTGKIMVVAPAGAYPTTSNFVVQPTITGFTPGFGPVGTSVTVFGANFNVGTPTVRLGGVPAAAPTGVSFGQLTVVVPQGATNAPLSVTTSDGSHTNATLFYLPPVLTAFTPTNSAPGTTVTLTGQNLLGASSVTFNTTPASFLPPTNNTTLHAVVPFGFSTGPISLATPGGATNSGSRFFYAPPEIQSFNPTHGLPGTNVVLFGANFLGTSVVRFNGVAASFAPPTNNSTLVATAPSGATTGPITVVAPAGTNTSGGIFTLDYTADLKVTATNTPNPVFVGSNLVYTVTVLNNGPFAAPAAVLTNTLPASVTLKSASSTVGTVNTSGDLVSVSFGSLNVGASATVTMNASPQTLGWITNIAVAASGYPDPSPADSTAVTAAFVQPLPLLSIRHSTQDRVRVSWPAALSNYTLQHRPVLEAASFWSNSPASPAWVGEERVVTESNSQPARYYRLKR